VRCVRASVLAFLTAVAFAPFAAAGEGQPLVVLEGAVRRLQTLSLDALQHLPAEHVQVSYTTERGTTATGYVDVLLWAMLDAAGGIADDAKGAELRHIVRVSGQNGYLVVISTGEIAPDFGGKPALIAYQRDGEPLDEGGLRLVMPGDKRGGRNVRDVVAIRVE
jgi:hypothetical protein